MGISLPSCDKTIETTKSDSGKNKIENMKVGSSAGSQVGQCSVNITWHRSIFKTSSGKICNCAKCFGLCKIDPKVPIFNSYILISNDSTYATIYSLSYLEDEDEFIVDNDIEVEFTIENGGFDGSVIFKAGDYDYIPYEENILIGDSTYLAYGSVDIDIEIE